MGQGQPRLVRRLTYVWPPGRARSLVVEDEYVCGVISMKSSSEALLFCVRSDNGYARESEIVYV